MTDFVQGPFVSPGPVQIHRRKAQRIARLFEIPNPDALHRSMQVWADVYYDTNSRDLVSPMKDHARNANKVFLSLRKTLSYLRDPDSLAGRNILSRLDHLARLRDVKALSDLDDVDVAVGLRGHEVLELLEEAADQIEAQLDFSPRPRIPEWPKNPGLRLMLANIGNYWIERSDAPGAEAFAPYWNEGAGAPGNKATQFTCFVCRIVDPMLDRSSVFSQMKKITMKQ
ncbi:hypothetical protein [Maricaulis sp.]|uniref:hypothetical protein n=1 Tax=Maricaulis sp. TaxID=1486257 RepID=UPI001B28B8D8|nr:hypothetical protein [Maricaulis sp.]MBO6796955.1 hypothetical protein [Maricaulis sp.]